MKKDIHKSFEEISGSRKVREVGVYSIGVENDIDLTRKISTVVGLGLSYLSSRKMSIDAICGMNYLSTMWGKHMFQ